MNFVKKIFRFHQNEEAATAIEYAVMLMLIIGVCIATIQLVGNETVGVWADNSDSIDRALKE